MLKPLKKGKPSTVEDLFFPNAHLVIDETVRLKLVTNFDQLHAYDLKVNLAQWHRLRRLRPLRNQVLGQILLLLTKAEPVKVKVVPELQMTRI